MGVLVAIVLLLAGGFLGLITATGSSSTERLLSVFQERTRNPSANMTTMEDFYKVDRDTLRTSAAVWTYFNRTVPPNIARFDKSYQVPMLKTEFGNLYEVFIFAHTDPGRISNVAKFLLDWYFVANDKVELLRGQDVDRFSKAILDLSTTFGLLNGSQKCKELLERLPHYRPNAGPSDYHIKSISFAEIIDEPIMEINHAITANKVLSTILLQKVEARIREAAVWIMFCYTIKNYKSCMGKLEKAYEHLMLFAGVDPILPRIRNTSSNPFRQKQAGRVHNTFSSTFRTMRI